YNFAAARLNPDGLLDSTFDGDGIAQYGLGGDDLAEAAAIDSQGRIVMVGESDAFGPNSIAVTRLNGANGAVDKTFFVATPGERVIFFPGRTAGTVSDVLIQSGDKIVITATNQGDFNLLRLLPNGNTDVTFGQLGRVVTDFGGTDSASGIIRSADGGLI